jgi:hypothetical protein
MLGIIDHISTSTASVLCMQLVARDFYPLFKAPFIMFPEERDAFRAALRRDDMTWLSKLEQLKGLDALSQAVCSACETRHHKAQFTLEELAKDPHQRRCIGTEEVVVMNGGRKATLNDIYDSVLDTCRREGFRAVYISKRDQDQTPQQARKPILETIIAHVTRQRQLDVTFHFRHSFRHKDTHIYDESGLELEFASADIVCPQLQAKLLRCETVTMNPEAFKRSIGSATKVYDRWGYQWHSCICRVSTCHESFWYENFQDCEVGDEKEMVLSTLRSYRADEDYVAPDWHRQIVLRLVHQQSELNAKGGILAGIHLYEAKEKGEWTWDLRR